MEQPSPDKDAPEENDIKKETETKDQIPENDTEKSAGKTSEAEEDKEKAEEDKEKAEADEGKTESDEEKAEAGKKGRTHDVPRARKKGFIKKHGKTVLILAVLLFVVFIIFRIYSVQKAVNEIASMPEPEFRDVERRDISNSIAVTATVEADDKRTVSTLVSNTKVLDVYYEVGDYVQEGDIICTFDTSNVSENIARLRKKMNVTSAKNQVAVKDAHVEVDKAGTT